MPAAIRSSRAVLPFLSWFAPSCGRKTQPIGHPAASVRFKTSAAYQLGALFVFEKYSCRRISRPFIWIAHQDQSSPRIEWPMSANQSTCTDVSHGILQTLPSARAFSIHSPYIAVARAALGLHSICIW